MTAFTYDAYREFLDRLRRGGYAFGTYAEPVPERTVVLRHDVDWSPERARQMARIEAERGVSATYFFLVGSPLYNVRARRVREVLETIESLGHRVGVHFSTHEFWADDPGESDLGARVREEQRVLSTAVDDVADAVSFHIPPDWVLGVDYEGFTNAYAPQFFEEITYVADSNQRWRGEPPLVDVDPDRVQVLVHPGLWASADGSFGERLDAERGRRLEAIRAYLDDQYGAVVDTPGVGMVTDGGQ
jgi:peptidoglycan/xylan/chitin deacetylase (PgdA/CDA1 family)